MRPAFFALLLLACASAPAPPAPGTGQAWGDVVLVPREGVKSASGSGSYGDRRQRDVEFVDYGTPGFAVVYVQSEPPPDQRLDLEILTPRIGTEIVPSEAAVGAAGRLSIHNGTARSHIVSYPAAGWVKELAPDERAEVAVPRSGEQRLYLLDTPAAAATVFAAPGPFSVVSPSGRFTLSDLAPGPTEIRAWHPRFPPAKRQVDLAADTSLRVDFEIGVGRGDGAAHAH